jgi:glutamine amidotransferase
MTVLIVDYGMGNLGSVRRALEECGADAIVSDDPAELAEASAIVLPGVGAFADGMRQLRERGWPAALRRAVRAEGLPLLGICLGMQLLAERGEEGGDTEGLGLVPGVVNLMAPADGARMPHVGWNDVHAVQRSPMFDSIPDGSDFYFVHSFHFVPANAAHIAARTCYGGDVVAAVVADNIWGAQFHPEKSSRAGFRLLTNFLTC